MRMLALVPAVMAVYLVVAVGTSLLADELGLWTEPFMGFITAAAVVATAFAVAPDPPLFRLLLAALVFVLGGAYAWILLDPPNWTPESWGPRAYELTNIPIAATLAGGLVSWLCCAAVASFRLRRPKPLQADHATRGR